MSTRFYDTDLTDAAWAWVAPVLPAARPGGRPRTTNLRAVLNAIFYLLRTGCQWRLLPREFPPCGTVYHYFQAWQNSGVWVHLHRVLYEQARRHAGRAACPSVVIMDGQSVKTTERGGARGFDAHKRVKGRKRHILVDTLGLLVANRVEPADTSDRRAGALLLGGLSALFPRIRTVIADAGHESRKFARTLKGIQVGACAQHPGDSLFRAVPGDDWHWVKINGSGVPSPSCLLRPAHGPSHRCHR